MKKITLPAYLSLMLMIYSCGTHSNIKTTDEKEHETILKHKIKSIAIFQTEYKNGIPQPEYLAQEKQFSKAGYKTEEKNYNNKGKSLSTIKYEYDKNNNLLLSIAKSADSGIIFRETRTYNHLNKREELIFYLPDGTYKYRNIAKYDENGNMEQIAWYWPEGLKAINKFSYKNGLKIEDTEYDPQNKFNYRWTFSYDNNGNQTEAIQIYPGNIVTVKIEYTYDSNNLVTKQVDYSGSSIRKQTFYNYDMNGLITYRAEVSGEGSIQIKARYKYSFY